MLKSFSIHYLLGFVCLELALVMSAADCSTAKAIKSVAAGPRKTAGSSVKGSTEDRVHLGEVLELKQTHRLYGPLTVSIASNACAVVSRGRDFKWVCKAPTWDVVAFNDVRKIVYVYPFKNWRKNGIRSALSVENNDQYLHWSLILSGRQKYGGLDAIIYYLPKGDSPLTTGPKLGEYWIHKRSGIDPIAIRFVQNLFDLPEVRGIPLRFTRAYGGHGWGFGMNYNKEKQQVSTWLTTTSAKVRKVDAQLFHIPVGYKPASDSEVLMRSSEVEETFGQILD